MLSLIASALKRNDEEPNIALAEELAKSKNENGIAEIVSGLNMDKATANDCIKVLYEIGERNPKLIVSYTKVFSDLLKSKNNRLVWGAMTALGQITALCPNEVFESFENIYAAFETGSVITVDQGISVFAALCKADKAFEQRILPVLINHFAACRAKEIPQHFERAAVCITSDNAAPFKQIIQKRYDEMTVAQQTRVNKAFKKIDSLPA